MKKWFLALFGLGVSAVAIWLVASKAELRETATLISSVGYRLPILLGDRISSRFRSGRAAVAVHVAERDADVC